MSDDDLEVYVFQGNDGEKVPRSVQHLVIKEGVDMPSSICREYEHLRKVTLPDGLTVIYHWAFCSCLNLVEINKIPNTVRGIGKQVFEGCKQLKKIEFEDNVHQLRTIDQRAFYSCKSLERVNLTSSMLKIVGRSAFYTCCSLIEANLSATCLTEIQDRVFTYCTSLLTVSLPNTIKLIGEVAFRECIALVTVVVPLDSQSITIEEACFSDCTSLANLVLPQGSTVGDYFSGGGEPFGGCRVLHARFGRETTSIVAGLVSRFDAYPIHRLCYDHTRTTVQELRQCISDHREANSVVDEFGMSPLHVFFSTPGPSVELLEVLLESLPYQLIQRKDANDKRSLDYLVANWTDANASLFQTTARKWVIDRLAHCGAMSWMEAMQSKVQEILSEQDKEQRSALSNELLSVFEHYSNVEATSMLELALWKQKLGSGWSSNSSKRQAVDRNECRCLSGPDIVIPNVWKFLDIAPQASSQGD